MRLFLLVVLALCVLVRTEKETLAFQAEVSKMMHLIINSVYKEREIFLRELVSNASDALDKLRFLALTEPDVLDGEPDLKISILSDPDQNIVVITDTGIGMTPAELKTNLGTLAKSGTADFVSAVESGKADLNLIGQFGVGFYSSFLVAERVEVISKHPTVDRPYHWESEAAGSFTVEEYKGEDAPVRGTKIILHLKDDQREYLNEDELKRIIIKYSEFINFPIHLRTSKMEMVEVDKPEETKDQDDEQDKQKEEEDKTKKDEDEAEVEDVEKEEEKSEEKRQRKTKKKVEKKIFEWQHINTQPPIWTRDPKTVNSTEYQSFFRAFTKEDKSEAATWVHFKSDGVDVSFKALIFVPKKAKSELYQAVRDVTRNVKLFVKRVFITDDFGDSFLPKWLNFLWIIIDAEDVPLNVSRETLQQHKVLKIIRKKLINKALELIGQLAKESRAKYNNFRQEFGVSLKLGAIEDKDHRPKVMKLVRFPTSASPKEVKYIGFDEYVGRMKKGQNQIFYMTGSSVDEIKQSPFVERVLARGYEVLYLDEPIDEYLVQSVLDFEGKPLQSVAKAGLRFGDEDEDDAKQLKDAEEKFHPLLSWLEEILFDFIEKATISNRLTQSPAALIPIQMGLSGNMERIMNAQAMQKKDTSLKDFYKTRKKNLEVNPKHPLIIGLLNHVEGNDKEDRDVELAKVLFEMVQIRSGYEVEDKKAFAKRVERVLRRSLKVDLDEEALVNEKPAPERETEEIPNPDEEEEEVSEKDLEDLLKNSQKSESHDEL